MSSFLVATSEGKGAATLNNRGTTDYPRKRVNDYAWQKLFTLFDNDLEGYLVYQKQTVSKNSLTSGHYFSLVFKGNQIFKTHVTEPNKPNSKS